MIAGRRSDARRGAKARQRHEVGGKLAERVCRFARINSRAAKTVGVVSLDRSGSAVFLGLPSRRDRGLVALGINSEVAAFIMQGDRWNAANALMKAQDPEAWRVLLAS